MPSTLNAPKPFVKILAAFLQRFESRGEPPQSARFGAAVASGLMLAVNLVTIMFFVDSWTSARPYRLLLSIPLNTLGVLSLVGLNWWLIGRIQRNRDTSFAPYLAGERARQVWLWYSVTSIILLFTGAIMATQR